MDIEKAIDCLKAGVIMSNLLKRVADYFANVYTGDDKTAPKLDLNVCELREIANMHVDKCKTEAELREAKETIRKLLCSEYGSSCSFCIQDKNPDAMCCNVGGSGSWCCENAKWNGKSKEQTAKPDFRGER